MALPLDNTFEGQADETAVTSGNSGGGSGDAFDTIEGTVTFDTAQAAHGTTSCRVDIVTSGTDNVQWRSTAIASPVTEMWGRVYFYLTANPAASIRLISLANSGLARRSSVYILSNGKVRVDDVAFASNDTVATIPLNQWGRIEFYCYSHATAGIIEAKLFTGDAGSPTETVTSPSTRDTGSGDLQLAGFGQMQSNSQTTTFWIDDLAVNSSGYPGSASGGGGGGGGTPNAMLLGVG